jgi:hypothetical protein
MSSENKTWNPYTARFFVTTVKRAIMEGQESACHDYGYVVRCQPKEPSHTSEVYCWCKTKKVAIDTLAGYENSKVKGFWGCPCGSNKQARLCCGVPQKEVK